VYSVRVYNTHTFIIHIHTFWILKIRTTFVDLFSTITLLRAAIPISVSRFGEISKSRNIRLSSCGEISRGEKHGSARDPHGSRRDPSRIPLA